MTAMWLDTGVSIFEEGRISPKKMGDIAAPVGRRSSRLASKAG